MEQKRLDEYFHKIYESLLTSLSEGHGGPFGAGIVMEDKLVSIGTNHVMSSQDVSRHAEVEALSNAAKKTGDIHLTGAVLLTSHFPCMMCYHAVKWANIEEGYYIFDYDDTENLFGFQGDKGFIQDLQIKPDFHDYDLSINWKKYDSPSIRKDYYENLVKVWNEKYKETLGAYDI